MSDFTLVGSEMHKVSFCGVSHNLICDGATLQPDPARRRYGETRHFRRSDVQVIGGSECIRADANRRRVWFLVNDFWRRTVVVEFAWAF